jgi:glyoxylase-like metal-dependent hydrolase (beta-lactamase superfamily II)
VELVGAGLSPLDLEHLGNDQVIASCLLKSRFDLALVDPGPSSTLPKLRSGLKAHGMSVDDISHILLTHIHLDHAGATGTLVAENPRIRVFVHQRGAAHLVAPERLLRSAERLYGSEMHRLWGEFLPVPSSSICSLDGGERIAAGGRTLEVLYTPGHASHHVSYLDTTRGLFFVGDTAGIRIAGCRVFPATPPPDIEVDLWNRSLDQICERRPEALFLTHFGFSEQVDRHISELRKGLTDWSMTVHRSLQTTGSDQSLSERFSENMRTSLWQRIPDTWVARYQAAGPLALSWYGLARYWRKRDPPVWPVPPTGSENS